MIKREIRQPESRSFSIGLHRLTDSGGEILVRQNQDLNPVNTLGFDVDTYFEPSKVGNASVFQTFYSRQSPFPTPMPALLADLEAKDKKEDISKFYPLYVQGGEYVPGYGVFPIKKGINYLVLCVPATATINPEGAGFGINLGFPVAFGPSVDPDYQDCMRLEVFESVPPTKAPYIRQDFGGSFEYSWQYCLPLARITLTNEIEIVNYEVGFPAFIHLDVAIDDVAAMPSRFPLELLSSFYE